MRFIFNSLIFLSTLSLFSQELVQDSVLVKKQLSNGLTYYIYPTDKVKGQAHFRLFVKVGSIQETEKQRGLAHFLEHMAFNGTKHFKANELIEFLETKGSKFGHDLNAHTSFEETIYKLKIPIKNNSVIDSTLTIMSDWMNGMLLDSLEVEKERGVVLSEWLSKQSPKSKKGNVFLKTLLNNSIYSNRTVIGDTISLKSFKLKELKSFYQKWYDPSIMAIAITGDVNPKEIEEKIILKFSEIPSLNPNIKLGSIEDYKKDSLIVYNDQWVKDIQLNYIQLHEVFKNVKTKESYYNYLNRVVVNKLISDRLAHLSFQKNKYENASININNFLKSKGVLLASIHLKPDNVLEGIEEFNKDFQQIFQHGFTDIEIEKVAKTMLSSFERKVNDKNSISASGMIGQMYDDFFYGNMIIGLKDEYELMKNYFSELNSNQILKYLKDYHNSKPFQYLLNVNSKDLKKIPKPEEILSKIQEFKNIKVAPFQQNFNIPNQLLVDDVKPGTIEKIIDIAEIDAKEIHLNNGAIVVYKKTNSSKESVVLAGFKKGGFYALDRSDYLNAQYVIPSISISGYGNFNREALSYFLSGNSAKVQFLADKTRSGFFGNSKIKDVETLFELFYLKATQPKVDSVSFNRIKELSIDNVSKKINTNKTAFQQEFKYLVKGKDYTTVPVTKKLLEKSLNQRNLVPIYNNFFGKANNYVITLISDHELKELLPYIKKYIGGLPKGDFSNSYKYSPKPLKKKDVSLIKNAEESSKATLTIVHQQRKKTRNFPKLELQNKILENVLQLELNKRLREDLGVVYGVKVSISSTKHPKELSRQTIALVCKPTDVDIISSEINKIIKEIVSGKLDINKDIEKTKNNLISKFNINQQKNSFWTKSIRDYYFNNYKNWDFITNYDSMLKNISDRDIQKLTKNYFIKSPRIKAILYPKKDNN